uniref:Uncharacterized protein n=1 Tax=Chromera velia CCMP2878 TaxID=1169474 RepID=A0A0G4FU08_9ALVE|eukprot:Cvel_3716.t1-p1 / transcript=Cvel_3716.t1 / gene=Cvel_3716 / organism=Chromera_velia_CCMP2878 / gene_product=hypothetical protein / transcript_product=hypothetical protein / location=Cvel_scaffold154:101340-103273(+) / protein_length=460 / sequence_SO=supercontig / SO=protein_coding / is_pseudo=false
MRRALFSAPVLKEFVPARNRDEEKLPPSSDHDEDLEAVETLLKAGARCPLSVEGRRADGKIKWWVSPLSPLVCACRMQNVDLVDKLIKMGGAHPNIGGIDSFEKEVSSDHGSPFFSSRRNAVRALPLEVMLRESADDRMGRDGAMNGELRLVIARKLIEAGARVKVEFKDGHSPLSLVCSWYGTRLRFIRPMAELLLEKGALARSSRHGGKEGFSGAVDRDSAPSPKRKSPLMEAIRSWTPKKTAGDANLREDIIKLLLDSGADPNETVPDLVYPPDHRRTDGSWRPSEQEQRAALLISPLQAVMKRPGSVDGLFRVATRLVDAGGRCLLSSVRRQEEGRQKGGASGRAAASAAAPSFDRLCRIAPLACAAEKGHVEMVRLLMEKGGADASVAGLVKDNLDGYYGFYDECPPIERVPAEAAQRRLDRHRKACAEYDTPWPQNAPPEEQLEEVLKLLSPSE